jgi:hypothetical protein
MSRRKWSSKDKLMIVLEGLKGQVPIGELCAKFQISQSLFYKWRDQLLSNGPKVFDYGGVDKMARPSHREGKSSFLGLSQNLGISSISPRAGHKQKTHLSADERK